MSWPILMAFDYDISQLEAIYLPNIGGIVNAEAIAIKSLKKNKFKDFNGKGLISPLPNLCAKNLSLVMPVLVLNTNTIRSFEIAGSNHDIV